MAQVVDVLELTASRGPEGLRAHDLAAARLRDALLAEVSLLEAFALTERQRITPLSLADVADVAVRLARRAIGPTPITLTTLVPRTLPPAIGIAGDVAEALYAVLANAIEAVRTQGGGEIVVRGAVEGDAVVMRVADTGPGVPEVLRDGDRIFELFVTGASTANAQRPSRPPISCQDCTRLTAFCCAPATFPISARSALVSLPASLAASSSLRSSLSFGAPATKPGTICGVN